MQHDKTRPTFAFLAVVALATAGIPLMLAPTARASCRTQTPEDCVEDVVEMVDYAQRGFLENCGSDQSECEAWLRAETLAYACGNGCTYPWIWFNEDDSVTVYMEDCQ